MHMHEIKGRHHVTHIFQRLLGPGAVTYIAFTINTSTTAKGILTQKQNL